MMKVRKVIKFGNNSFVVTMPKPWIDKNNIKKGDIVYVNENGHNELVLAPHSAPDQKVKLRQITINIDSKDMDDIKREINTAYINNYHVIRIEGKNLEKKVRDIRKHLGNLMALEVVEQTNNHIEAKDFLNMRKISIPGTIRKIDAIVRSMITDAKSTFEHDSYENILIRDDDVNRLVSLVVRVSRYALKKPYLVNDIGLTPFDFYRYLIVADALEKIGDETKRISRYLRKTSLSRDEQESFMQIYSKIENFYQNVLECFYTNDAATALKLASTDRKIREECDSFLYKYHQNEFMPIVAEKLKSMGYLIHTIGREVYQGEPNDS